MSETVKQKWTTTVGPRLTKKFESAWSELTRLQNTFKEITDTNPDGFVFWSPFSGPGNPEADKMIKAIGDRVEWTITKDNLEPLIKTIMAAVKVVPIPVIDKRTTEEEQLQRHRDLAISAVKQQEEAKVHKAAYDAALAKYRKLYPWAKQTDSKKSGPAVAAANIKKMLSIDFPGIVFSVKSESFAGGNSVNVRWELGPTTKQVDAVINAWEPGKFNGMIDLYEYDHDAEGEAFRAHMGQTKYASSHREYSVAFRDQVAKWISEVANFGDSYGGQEICRVVNLAIEHSSFPAGAVPNGVRRANQDGDPAECLYLVTYKPIAEPIVEKPVNGWYDQYQKFQAKYPDDIILLHIDGNYEAYGDNAKILHDELMLPLGKREEITMASFPDAVQLSHLDILKNLKYTVTVFELSASTIPNHIEKHYHTKKKCDFWILVIDADLETDVFNGIRVKAKSMGGWYSRQWGKTPGGFGFESEAEAIAFAATI